MDWTAWLVLGIGAAVLIGGVLVLGRQGHPPDHADSTLHESSDLESDRLYGGTDRPAGPDAEDPPPSSGPTG
jgi:hypothetical protein